MPSSSLVKEGPHTKFNVCQPPGPMQFWTETSMHNVPKLMNIPKLVTVYETISRSLQQVDCTQGDSLNIKDHRVSTLATLTAWSILKCSKGSEMTHAD